MQTQLVPQDTVAIEEPRVEGAPRRDTASSSVRFLVAFVLFAIAAMTPVLALNFLIDPLWYYSGNRLGPHSEPFNTRISKLILAQRGAIEYDCVVFGPSVTTLFDQTKVGGVRCYNAAFTDGRVEEFPVYARYLQGLGLDAKAIIVDLTPRNFAATRPRLRKLPDFAEDGSQPTPAVRAYAAFDTFWFSLRSAFGVSGIPQYYDRNFVSHLKPWEAGWSQAKIVAEFRSYRDFSTDSLEGYSELLAVWPKAKKIGIVSFVSANAVVTWQEDGILENYIKTSYEASKLFDAYYDFTAPSAITVDLSMSPDGLHFVERPHWLMAERINGQENGFGIDARGRSFEDFRTEYLAAIEEWTPRILVSTLSSR